MTEDVPSISEICREWIKSQYQLGLNFSLSKERNAKFKEFCETGEYKKILNYDKHKGVMLNQMHEVAKTLGIDPRDWGLQKPPTKFEVNQASDQKSRTTFHPKEVGTKTENDSDKQKANQNQDASKSNSAYTAPDLDDETCGYPFKIMTSIIHARYEKFDDLSDSEVEQLGKAWKPIFQKYLNKDWMLWLLPMITTGGIFMPRIMKLAKKDGKKDDVEKKRDIANEKTSQPAQSNDKSESTEKPPKSSKPYSSKKMAEIERQAQDEAEQK